MWFVWTIQQNVGPTDDAHDTIESVQEIIRSIINETMDKCSMDIDQKATVIADVNARISDILAKYEEKNRCAALATIAKLEEENASYVQDIKHLRQQLGDVGRRVGDPVANCDPCEEEKELLEGTINPHDSDVTDKLDAGRSNEAKEHDRRQDEEARTHPTGLVSESITAGWYHSIFINGTAYPYMSTEDYNDGKTSLDRIRGKLKLTPKF